jgi:hypothetical protein
LIIREILKVAVAGAGSDLERWVVQVIYPHHNELTH